MNQLANDKLDDLISSGLPEFFGHLLEVWYSDSAVHGMCHDCDLSVDYEAGRTITNREARMAQMYIAGLAMETDCE